jgi:hypothetical protein
MKKIIIVFLIAVMLSGCIGTESITGTYLESYNTSDYFPRHMQETLTVYPDSTFLLKISDGEVYSGVVRKEGNEYIFTAPLLSFSAKLDHGNLTNDDGGIAVRVK